MIKDCIGRNESGRAAARYGRGETSTEECFQRARPTLNSRYRILDITGLDKNNAVIIHVNSKTIRYNNSNVIILLYNRSCYSLFTFYYIPANPAIHLQ